MNFASLAMGAQHNGVTVRDMTCAFATFANDGVYREGRTFTKVLDSDGNVVLDNTQDSNQAISKKTAWYSTYMMTNTVLEGTGVGAQLDRISVAGRPGQLRRRMADAPSDRSRIP